MAHSRKFAHGLGCGALLLLAVGFTARIQSAFPSTRSSRASRKTAPTTKEQRAESQAIGTLGRVNPPDQEGAQIHAKLRRWLQAETDSGPDEPALMRELLTLLRDENAASIVRMLSSEELNSPFGLAALDRWLKHEPAKAAEWLATSAKLTDELALLVARHLADAPALLDGYCERLADLAWRQKILMYSSLTVASSAPERAIALAGLMESGVAQKNALLSVVNAWALNDPGSALAWVVGVKDPLLQRQLLGAEAQAIAVTDPDLAAEWMGAPAAVNEPNADVVSEIIRTWAAKAPADAASWVMTFAPGAARNDALTNVARRWMQSDPEQALAWIQALPETDRPPVVKAAIASDGS
jgi:hypothetical protein